jgi:TrmH family RNA methyltransferase
MSLSKLKLKYLRSLRQKKFRDREGKFIVEGFRLTSEALASDFPMELLVFTDDFLGNPDHARLVHRARERKIPVEEVSRRELDSFADTVTSQGVAAVIGKHRYSLDDILKSNRGGSSSMRERRPQVVVALDGVSDPGNVGTIIRTADWFGACGVVMGEGSVELYNPKVVRSTMGSIFHLPILPEANLLKTLGELRKQKFVLLAASPSSPKSYLDVPYFQRTALILGNEARGVSAEVSKNVEFVVSIKRLGNADSLNVGVSCGILLSRFCQRDGSP